jgi:Mg2+/Co2+ transporter CorB
MLTWLIVIVAVIAGISLVLLLFAVVSFVRDMRMSAQKTESEQSSKNEIKGATPQEVYIDSSDNRSAVVENGLGQAIEAKGNPDSSDTKQSADN